MSRKSRVSSTTAFLLSLTSGSTLHRHHYLAYRVTDLTSSPSNRMMDTDATPLELTQCAACNKSSSDPGTSTNGLQRCSKCKATYYCVRVFSQDVWRRSLTRIDISSSPGNAKLRIGLHTSLNTTPPPAAHPQSLQLLRLRMVKSEVLWFLATANVVCMDS